MYVWRFTIRQNNLMQFSIGLTPIIILTASREKQQMCYLVGLNLFFMTMTMQAAALSVPGRDSEMPEVINSSGGAGGLHDIQHQIVCSSLLSFVN